MSSSSENNDAASPKASGQDFFSWTILTPFEVVKHLDKSSIKYRGTAVPKELLVFFDLDSVLPPNTLNAVYKKNKSLLKVNIGPFDRVRIFWSKEISSEIERLFPVQCAKLKDGEPLGGDELLMKFTKEDSALFRLSVFSLSEIERPEALTPEEYSGHYEGKLKETYMLQRIRSAENRRKAIEHHGVECAVCGFNFEKAYGELGKGFIEIHHRHPLGESDAEVLVNPETDLIPLCPNCHRMIHRKISGDIGIDDLKEIWMSMHR
jgi:5-methylcytosine-specific restriction protein A